MDTRRPPRNAASALKRDDIRSNQSNINLIDLGIGIDRAVWQTKGWYLTENWRVRAAAEPVPPVPQRPWQVIRDEALAMMDEMTHGPPPD